MTVSIWSVVVYDGGVGQAAQAMDPARITSTVPPATRRRRVMRTCGRRSRRGRRKAGMALRYGAATPARSFAARASAASQPTLRSTSLTNAGGVLQRRRLAAAHRGHARVRGVQVEHDAQAG